VIIQLVLVHILQAALVLITVVLVIITQALVLALMAAVAQVHQLVLA
jgi:hypothetical protein